MKKIVNYSACLIAFIIVMFTFIGCSKESKSIESGKYYLNGDTSQKYIEFYEDDQLALMNFDGLEFAKSITPKEENVSDEEYQKLVAPVINGMNQKLSYWYDEDFSEYGFSFPGWEDVSFTPFVYSTTGDSPMVTLADQEYILIK